ncbi:NAD-dependent epimerase/dehydratase family protein [Coleofasciculus chthonoplastes]|uniref:NAD-dependent epimerase/dehydratase family protein n=1 Tax=Coleofasciculus chthonoplastes TaxID=64178 RepID=UPI003301DEA1
MKYILVTGATGFIGRHLITRLQDLNWRVKLAIRHISNEKLPSINISVIDNINETTDWTESLKDINLLVHLAGSAHIFTKEKNHHEKEQEFFKVNTTGTANLVKQSIAAGVKHFVFISSIGAMATLSDHPLTETSPCQPDTPYGRSKLQAEQALIELASQSSMTWTILRPTLVYGSGNPGNMERLIKLINRGLPLPFGLVNNRRSLLYVGNLVDAIATCLTHPNAKNQTFLVSDGQDLSTPELIHKIAYHLERPCHLLPVPPSLLKLAGHLGDTIEQFTKRPLPLNSSTIDRLLGSLIVDSSHIRNTLNWEPPYTVDEGLSKTLR